MENNKYSFLSCKLVLVLVKVLHFKGYQTLLTTSVECFQLVSYTPLSVRVCAVY